VIALGALGEGSV